MAAPQQDPRRWSISYPDDENMPLDPALVEYDRVAALAQQTGGWTDSMEGVDLTRVNEEMGLHPNPLEYQNGQGQGIDTGLPGFAITDTSYFHHAVASGPQYMPAGPALPATPQHHLLQQYNTPPPSEGYQPLNPQAPWFVPGQLNNHPDNGNPYTFQNTQLGIQTPVSLIPNNLPFRPPPEDTPTRPKRARQSPVQTSPEQPFDVDTWRGGNPNNTNRPNQLPLPTPTRPTRRTRTASNAHSTTSFTCPSEGCDKKFTKKADMDHHRRYHEGRRHFCSLCDSAFHFAKDLKRHMKVHSPQERHLMCNVIGCRYHTEGFQRKDHLQRHLRKVHQMELPPTPESSTRGA